MWENKSTCLEEREKEGKCVYVLMCLHARESVCVYECVCVYVWCVCVKILHVSVYVCWMARDQKQERKRRRIWICVFFYVCERIAKQIEIDKMWWEATVYSKEQDTRMVKNKDEK